MKTFKRIRYNIEVNHEPGTYNNDMDFMASDIQSAYKQLQVLKLKYPGHEIKIERITETKTYESLLEKDLEEISSKSL